MIAVAPSLITNVVSDILFSLVGSASSACARIGKVDMQSTDHSPDTWRVIEFARTLRLRIGNRRFQSAHDMAGRHVVAYVLACAQVRFNNDRREALDHLIAASNLTAGLDQLLRTLSTLEPSAA